jgi:hypothetical protein
MDWCFEILDAFESGGWQAGMEVFARELVGFEDVSQLGRAPPQNMQNFFLHEFMQFAIYCPDLRKIKNSGVSIVVAAGEKSKDAFYARATIPQAEIIQCRRFIVPGNHAGFMFEPEAFSETLFNIFQTLEEKV